jgi:hypothetical protein
MHLRGIHDAMYHIDMTFRIHFWMRTQSLLSIFLKAGTRAKLKRRLRRILGRQGSPLSFTSLTKPGCAAIGACPSYCIGQRIPI